MKYLFLLFLVFATSCGHYRHIRTAKDVTPGNPRECVLDWRYGANDIRIQTTKVNRMVWDRWFDKTGYDVCQGKPRLIITEVQNDTDMYIPTSMVRDIFEGVAADDGRFTVVVGDSRDGQELDQLMHKIQRDPKYFNQTSVQGGNATAPRFLAKVRITKATTYQPRYDLQDYRMTLTLYDIETQEVVDQAWDVLRKKVRA